MADYAKLNNAMKNALHAISEKSIMNGTPDFALANYKLGYLSSMMVGFLSQQPAETRQAFFDLVDELLMNHALNKELKMSVDTHAQAS